jgi:hypothetical protein
MPVFAPAKPVACGGARSRVGSMSRNQITNRCNSPFRRMNSPFGQKGFPVFAGAGNCCNQLNPLGNLSKNRVKKPESCKISMNSLFFPANRESPQWLQPPREDAEPRLDVGRADHCGHMPWARISPARRGHPRRPSLSPSRRENRRRSAACRRGGTLTLKS